MSKGYPGTSTREIARKVGITQPNFYHYLNDKERLYTVVSEKHLEDVGKTLRKIVQTNETTLQVVLTKTAQFLIEAHLVGLSPMLHDLESNLPNETKDHLLFLWERNHHEPLEEIFSINRSVLRSGISKEIVARHFFSALAPYITRSKRPVEEPLSVEQLIDLYLNGVLGQT